MKEVVGASSVDVDGAREVIFAVIQRVEKEQTGIVNAFGRTLAEDVEAHIEVPLHDTALVDGYAVVALDTEGATDKNPSKLGVLADSIKTGKRIQPGTAVRVRKGDAVPEGADTVVRSADSYRPDGDPELLILKEYKKGENIRAAGEIISGGELVLQAGAVIQGAEMGLLASLGRHGIWVSRKPRISVITTGEGIVEILDELEPGEIRNNVRYMLVGQVLEAGCELGRLIHIRDGRIALERAMIDCNTCDATIIALGPNDKHDIALASLENLGFIHFNRMHIEPGSATAFGTIEGKPVFITSTESIFEVYETIIRPGLMRMLGRTNVDRRRERAKIQAAIKLNPGSAHYLKALTRSENGELITRPILPSTQGVKPWTIPNSIIIIPTDTPNIKRGDIVDVMMMSS